MCIQYFMCVLQFSKLHFDLKAVDSVMLLSLTVAYRARMDVMSTTEGC